MGLTNDEDRQMLKEIHECILGTFDKQGLLSRICNLEAQVSTFRKALVFIGTTVVGLICQKAFEFLTK